MNKDDACERLRLFIVTERHARRLTQDDVAKRGKISRGNLASFEAGRNSMPSQSTLEGIARGLGIPYETLDRMARGLPAFATVEERAHTLTERINKLPEAAQAMVWAAVEAMIQSQDPQRGR